ncbi:hypothetical protein C8J55DRAFT_566351 [Lentinula edodes]|uniref:Uncharacterized protein n=1 Tax=Lentinula lateritia TaxID=40482 RepID=A0A9W8ZSD9_9AGAR|nr:hypothetical protein C8J55DRAFT_566351 [Lentinula edodes]
MYILLPYPYLPPFPHALQLELDQCMAQHQQLVVRGPRLTRAQVQEWRSPWFSKWLADGISCQLIIAWIQKALHLQEIVDYAIDDILNLFLSVVVLLYQDTAETALEELAALQRCLAQNYSIHQRNLVLDMLNQIEDLIDSDGDDDKHLDTKEPVPMELSLAALIQRCENWACVLREGLLENSSETHSKLEQMQKKIALNIREMKRVRHSLSHTPEFQAALLMSKLPSVIVELSNPVYAYRHGRGPHHAHLLRCHGFGLVLGGVLDNWTLPEQTKTAAENLGQNSSNPCHESNTQPMKTGAQFFKALKDHPLLIPRVSNPASILFLCSEENFIYSWNRWLSWFLKEEKYAVHKIHPRKLYQSIQTYLFRLKQEPTAPNWPPELRLIVDRTLEFWVLRDEVEDNTFSADKKHYELGLERIAADEDILHRCGKLVILFVNPDDNGGSGETVDFVWYNAFGCQSGGHFERLVHHSSKVSAVKPVRRGGKFDLWSSGQMRPYGWRQPSGGRLGDTYAPYAGMEAESVEGITILFEHAETSCILMGTAKSFHRKLWRQMKDASKECERVGLAGVNIFDCRNYTSPQHADNDCVRSLCAQIILDAEAKWSEFSFCATQYGSFDSSKLHGTMLPSERTVMRLRGGAGRAGTAGSVGPHVTTRQRDQARAQRNEQIRQNYPIREQVWHS